MTGIELGDRETQRPATALGASSTAPVSRLTAAQLDPWKRTGTPDSLGRHWSSAWWRELLASLRAILTPPNPSMPATSAELDAANRDGRRRRATVARERRGRLEKYRRAWAFRWAQAQAGPSHVLPFGQRKHLTRPLAVGE